MKGKTMRFCQAYESCPNIVHHAKINDPSIAANYGCIVYFKTKSQWNKKASDGLNDNTNNYLKNDYIENFLFATSLPQYHCQVKLALSNSI